MLNNFSTKPQNFDAGRFEVESILINKWQLKASLGQKHKFITSKKRV